MSSFGIYLIGFLVLAAGILIGANMLGVHGTWLFVTGLVLVGLGVITGVARTKRRDVPTDQAP